MAENELRRQRIALTTCGSPEEASELARELVSRRLAACVNVLPGAQSFYWWDDSVTEDAETLLIIKTRVDMLPALEAAILELHPYDLPEFIAFPVSHGSEAYLSWIDRNLVDG